MESRYDKLTRLISPATLFPLAGGILVAAIVPYIAMRYFYIDPAIVSPIQTAWYALLALFVLVTFLRAFLLYLEPTSFRVGLGGVEVAFSDQEKPSPQLKSVSQEVAKLREEIKQINSLKIDSKDIDKAQLVEAFKETIERRLTEDVLGAIDEEFAKRDLQNKKWERLITSFIEIRTRLYEETNNLARRANLNLAFGSLTTVLAGIGLIFIVFFRPLDLVGLSKDEYAWRIIAHYVPRLSLIVFAELFAYFFLRLYKAGLSDIKYYQNELSNVELKLVALKAALATQDNEILRLVIADLSKTERNFILKKDETTIDLEKLKAESTSMKDWLEQMVAIVKAKS